MLSVFALLAQAPLPTVGEIRLNDQLAANRERRMQFIRVDTVLFSPDNTRLAIEFADASSQYVLQVNRPAPRRFILVVPVSQPAGANFWIDPSKGDFSGRQAPESELFWAPDGNGLMYANLWIHLPGGETCRMPFGSGSYTLGSGGSVRYGPFLGFLNSAAGLFSASPGAPHQSLPSAEVLRLVDSQCRVTEEWVGAPHGTVDGMSRDGKSIALLSVVQKSRGPSAATLTIVQAAASVAIAGSADGTPRKRLDLDHARTIKVGEPAGSNTVFTDNAVCRLQRADVASASLVSAQKMSERQMRDVAIRCWDLATGKSLRRSAPGWTWGSLAPLTAGGGLVAVGDNGYTERAPRAIGLRVNLRMQPPTAIPPVRAIWDVHGGKMIARWTPETDEGNGAGWGQRLGFAISPDGRMVAEARSDRVLLYRVPGR